MGLGVCVCEQCRRYACQTSFTRVLPRNRSFCMTTNDPVRFSRKKHSPPIRPQGGEVERAFGQTHVTTDSAKGDPQLVAS